MFSKELAVDIRASTWGSRPQPSWIAPSRRVQPVDVGKALLLLGSITTPTGLSAGSPERYWACIRYFSACAVSDDLRLAMPFTLLDPHQKGILSDDFGVAISTGWLIDTLGGVRDVVDGRQFILNMGVRAAGQLPKVGPAKCPDFVLQDANGKFHVLECKGTQSGRSYLNDAMKIGLDQKRGIEIEDTIRGESLVIGLSLADEASAKPSQLVVIDPIAEPLTIVDSGTEQRANDVLARLRLAKALNLVGFPRLAFEISLPSTFPRNAIESNLLTPGERGTLALGYENRERDWMNEIEAEFITADARRDRGFIVQRAQFELPAIKLDSGRVARRVTAQRGVSINVLQNLTAAGTELHEAACEVAGRIANERDAVHFSQSDSTVRLEYPNLFFSEIAFD